MNARGKEILGYGNALPMTMDIIGTTSPAEFQGEKI
jgi:hypothetical protein